MFIEIVDLSRIPIILPNARGCNEFLPYKNLRKIQILRECLLDSN